MRIKQATYKIIGKFGTYEIKLSQVKGLRLRQPVAVKRNNPSKR